MIYVLVNVLRQVDKSRNKMNCYNWVMKNKNTLSLLKQYVG